MQLGNRNINDNLQNRGVKYWMQYPLLIKKTNKSSLWSSSYKGDIGTRKKSYRLH